MKILFDRTDAITAGSVCAIGGFDGIHRGHQAIIQCVKEKANTKNHTGIITFIPIPFFVLKGRPEICLTSKREKEAVLREFGIDFIYYFKFTKKFSLLSPAQFVSRITEHVKPGAIVVGANFRFGNKQKGSVRTLRSLAKDKFTVHSVQPVMDGEKISSTRIRELLLLGNIQAANKLLGRDYEIHGRVVKGQGRGQHLGFPTININVTKDKLVPLDGVYAVRVLINDRQFDGAMFCRSRLLEVYMLDFKETLYGSYVTVAIQRRIRAIQQFSNNGDLSKAIAHDVAAVRKQ